MGKKRWSRICKKAIAPGGSQEGNTHADCMDSVGYGMRKTPPAGRPNFSAKGGGRGAAASQNNYGR